MGLDWLQQGVAVAVLGWFMLRLERILMRQTDEITRGTRANLLLLVGLPSVQREVYEEAVRLLRDCPRKGREGEPDAPR